jgi:hypothetical protein
LLSEISDLSNQKDAILENAKSNKIFKFAIPELGILSNKFNYKRHESASRIDEQESIDRRPNKRANVLSKSLEK